MTMSGTESGSVQEAPLKATANCMEAWSGSRMRTSLPVKMAGAWPGAAGGRGGGGGGASYQ
jgi:hypothetical protein